jgi:hypothetical protein
MNNIFVDPKEKITVTIVIGQQNGKIVSSISEEELKKNYKNIDMTTVESHQITFRRPNYKDNIDILRVTMTTDGDEVKIDAATLRYERFVSLVQSWTFKNGENAISANRENINKLEFGIANTIMDALDNALGSM